MAMLRKVSMKKVIILFIVSSFLFTITENSFCMALRTPLSAVYTSERYEKIQGLKQGVRPRGERKLADVSKEWRRVSELIAKRGCSLELTLCNMAHNVDEVKSFFSVGKGFLTGLYKDATFISFELSPTAVSEFIKGAQRQNFESSKVAQNSPFWKGLLTFSYRHNFLKGMYGVDASKELRCSTHRILRELKRDFFPDDKNKVIVRLGGSKVRLKDIGFNSDEELEIEEFLNRLNLSEKEYSELKEYKIIWLDVQGNNPYRQKQVVIYYPTEPCLGELIKKLKDRYGEEICRISNGEKDLQDMIYQDYIINVVVILRDVAQARWMGEDIYRFLRDNEKMPLPDKLHLIHFGGALHYSSLRFILERYGGLKLINSIDEPRKRLLKGQKGSNFLATNILEILNNTKIEENELVVTNPDYFIDLFGRYLEAEKPTFLHRTIVRKLAQKDDAKVEELLKEALIIAPNDIDILEDGLNLSIVKGVDSIFNFPYDEIEEQCNRILTLEPGNSYSLSQLLFLYDAKCLANGSDVNIKYGELHRAILSSSRITLDEYLKIGDFYLEHGPDFYRTGDIYRKVVEYDPDNPIALSKLKEVYSNI